MTQNNRKVLVTSALPYVNNIPHLGNLICVISADIYTRFLRLKKVPVISILGTDEHGTTTQTKALEEGVTPREICDKYFAIHKEIYEWFNTQFDCLGRTSSKDNAEVTVDIYTKLKENGFIIQKEVEQFFDEEKQMFLADRFVEGTCPHCGYEDARGDQCDKCGKLLEPHELLNPRSKLSGKQPVRKKSEHLYIDLPKIEPELRKWIESSESNWSENAKQITHSWLKQLLEPRAITRDLEWGIPVPHMPKKVFYSWFDAPIGYISITKECRDDWKEWWHNPKEVQLVQFMGKDNTQFHTILFPSFLLGAKDNYTLLHTLSVNEFLNYADGKFSKSRGTGVFGHQAKDTNIPADSYRYYLTAIRPEKEDTVFDWLDFQQKINRELIDNYANLVNRTISFTNRFFDGIVPKLESDDCDIKELISQIDEAYESNSQKNALKHCMSLSKQLNQYFQEKQPWKNPKESANVLAVLLNKINDVTIALSPIIPKITQEVFKQLASTHQSWDDIGTHPLKEGHKLGVDSPLLKKLEDDQITQLKERFGDKKKTSFPLDLRVAQVEKVEQHPNADKLYVIQLDVGDHKRQIVSGLREHYTPEELTGKKIILVSNLKAAKLRGVESNGMLLAGMDENKKVQVLEVKHSKLGDRALFDGFTSQDSQIEYTEFAKVKMIVKDKKVLLDGKALHTSVENVTVPLSNGSVS